MMFSISVGDIKRRNRVSASLHREAVQQGSKMRGVLDQLEGLIQFQGLNFRSTVITCEQCGWNGTGGSLEVPGLAATGEPVIYACPACMESVAVHNGLSDQEVMTEMEKIREVLAAELVDTCSHPDERLPIAQAASDFNAIRAQLPTELDVTTDVQETAVTEATEDQSGALAEEAPELDFAAIRARLGAIA
jgi:hypothetical protein